MNSIFSFPNPVNEKAARVVAGSVAILAILGLVTGWMWLLPLLAVGFWLRVASGPRFSPLGLLATKLIAPLLGEPKLVPGPPKRFAQAIGAATTTTGAILALAVGSDGAGYVVFGIMTIFATLESVFAFCVGCKLFSLLMRIGIVPEEICEACADISLRRT